MAEDRQEQEREQGKKPMERPLSWKERLARLGVVLGLAGGTAGGYIAGRVHEQVISPEKSQKSQEQFLPGGMPSQEMPLTIESAEKIITVEQRFFERIQKLEKEIKNRHNSPEARVSVHEKSDAALFSFGATIKDRFQERYRSAGISGGIGDPEVSFTLSRLKNSRGEEIKQAGQGIIFPNKFSSEEFNKLLQDAPEAQWEISGFRPYSAVSDRYGDNYGSLTALIPARDIPKVHFLFVFSHNRDNNMWAEQKASAFNATVEGEKFIFVDLKSYNPTGQNPYFTSDKPLHDKVAIFITDINGTVLEEKTLQQAHTAPTTGF